MLTHGCFRTQAVFALQRKYGEPEVKLEQLREHNRHALVTFSIELSLEEFSKKILTSILVHLVRSHPLISVSLRRSS